MSDQQLYLLAGKTFQNSNSLFPSNSSYNFEERQDELIMPSLNTPKLNNNNYTYETEKRRKSSNKNLKSNTIHQASPAQIERMKNYKSSLNITSQSTNYELVKKLESIAANHYTSVPIVVKSWNKQRFNSGNWCLEDLVDDFENGDAEYYLNNSYNTNFWERIKLTDSEISSLDAAVF